MCMKLQKLIFVLFVLIFSFIFANICFAQTDLTGKDIFYKVKGPLGSCSTCHPGGGSAGRWDSEAKEINNDGDRLIPSLKGIGKKKSSEQIEKIIRFVSTRYKVPVNDKQIKALVNYVSGL